ncbi:MAG: DEAD/DEAH box helicase [Mogibacterium sp.]|nr:DEAD/DEAH box helicase [Mogibacterium sp.]
MIIRIDYDSDFKTAILSPEDKDEWKWITLTRMLYDSVPGIVKKGDNLYIPIRRFLSVRYTIADYSGNHGIKVVLTNAIKEFLREANKQSYTTATKKTALSEEYVKSRLEKVGFKRKLTDNQLANLCKIGALPAGATFSVPGAGKTTEALAYFFLNAEEDDKLLVVAPKNAFGAWDEQLESCMQRSDYSFVRLRGGEARIDLLLRESPKFAIITYQQYPRVAELIQHYLEHNQVFMFLDESHRIKSGRAGISAEAILGASYLPKQKLIMSGTPMPQSQKDLVPQFTFLYPDRIVNEDTAISLIQPIYVRTTSGQLGIPEVEHRLVSLEMSPLQREIYTSIKSETKRQLIPMLSDLSRVSLRDINKKIMKVMQFVSNPALLARDMEYIFDERIGELLLHDSGPKITYACQRARELASEGKKVIIWSQFVENVELIAERLKDIGADYIHGGVDAGDEDEDDTREWKIKEFHKNPNKMVLVANPAAASEGISLHTVCQYAIYVDRSFNAAHYLQSEDRIHRLGLKEDQIPIVEIVECKDSIDEVIRQRLETKVAVMAAALNDPSLDIGTVRYDVDFESDEDDITTDDINAIARYFGDS